MQLIPYGVNSLALIVPASNPNGIKAPKDLAGKVVGVEIAGFEEKTLRGAGAASSSICRARTSCGAPGRLSG